MFFKNQFGFSLQPTVFRESYVIHFSLSFEEAAMESRSLVPVSTRGFSFEVFGRVTYTGVGGRYPTLDGALECHPAQ